MGVNIKQQHTDWHFIHLDQFFNFKYTSTMPKEYIDFYTGKFSYSLYNVSTSNIYSFEGL